MRQAGRIIDPSPRRVLPWRRADHMHAALAQDFMCLFHGDGCYDASGHDCVTMLSVVRKVTMIARDCAPNENLRANQGTRAIARSSSALRWDSTARTSRNVPSMAVDDALADSPFARTLLSSAAAEGTLRVVRGHSTRPAKRPPRPVRAPPGALQGWPLARS